MREHFVLKETSAWITADDERYIEIAKEQIKEHRKELERFIRWHPFFLVTLEPYRMDDEDEGEEEIPEVVRRMIRASAIFGVGPMSAVAGTLAELAVEAMRDAGATHAMVDNGGDVALISDRELLVGIYAGDSPFSNRIAFRVRPSSSLIGICTSSGTVGHSISFGHADAATVIGSSASLADAAATALCNSVRGAHSRSHPHPYSLAESFRSISHVAGIKGAVVIYHDVLAKWGEIPPLVRLSSCAHPYRICYTPESCDSRESSQVARLWIHR